MKFKNITNETILVRLEVGADKIAVKPDQIVEVDEYCHSTLLSVKEYFVALKSEEEVVEENNKKKQKK